MFTYRRTGPLAGTAITLGVTLSLAIGGSAHAATTLAGPINLGSAAPFGVLAASAVTNTGPSVINGDVGVSPGTSITGFPPGTLIGTGVAHQTDAVAAQAQAQADTTTAYNDAASLTPTSSGLRELNGLSLTPGVYSGGALDLSNNGALTLAGTAQSVWVFQAASSLTIGSGTTITLKGGASACNVFWQVGSSATLGSAAQFRGTILAKQAITATTGATIVGRLLANTAAITLDTNTITTPTGCTPGTTPVTTTSPAITSGTPPTATAGTPYRFRVTATGTPAPTYTVTSGALPAGLTLNAATGAITGTPTTPGTSTFSITATNGIVPPVSATYTLTIKKAAAPTPTLAPTPVPTSTSGGGAPASGTTGSGELAFTGSHIAASASLASVLVATGFALIALSRRRNTKRLRRLP